MMRHQILIPFLGVLTGCTASENIIRDKQGHIVSIDMSRGIYVPGSAEVIGEPNRRPKQASGMLKRHGSLSRLVSLNLSGQEVDARELENVSASLLAQLNLSATNFSDRDLKVLARFPRLKTLDLSGTAITDDGLVHLLHLRELTTLSVDDTLVTGKGLNRVLQLPSVTIINARNTKIEDEDIAKALRRNVKINAEKWGEVI